MRNGVIKLLRGGIDFEPRVIFDVGANVGQSATEFAVAWPNAVVHTFEPIPKTFAALSEAVSDLPNVAPHQIAFGERPRRIQMLAVGTSFVNRILAGPSAKPEPTVDLDMETLDAFCDRQSIRFVDFLKIDTEGYDLKVLVGSVNMLRHLAVRFIQVECGLAPDNRRHVALQRFCGFLEPFGYTLFGLFDIERRVGKQPRLGAGFGNAVFVHEP